MEKCGMEEGAMMGVGCYGLVEGAMVWRRVVWMRVQ